MLKKYNGQNDIIGFSRQQIRDFDKWAIEQLKVPGAVLMENAGRSCGEFIAEKLPDNNKKVCIICGKGNNGGDGYVIARHLLNRKYNVNVILLGSVEKVKGDAKINLDVLQGIAPDIITEVYPSSQGSGEIIKNTLNDSDFIVDAIFGTGLSGKVKDDYIEILETVNSQDKPVFAVDIPSGLDCDKGEPLGAAVKADWTVTFAALKKGFENPQSTLYTGDVYIASIGVEPFMRN